MCVTAICVTAICVTLYFMWSVAGDADEPGTGFPIPNLLVCPAKPIFVARPLAQQHNKQCRLPPPSPLQAAVLKQLFEACFHQATSANT